MENQEKKNVDMARHAVGNKLGSALGRSTFALANNKNLTQEHIQDMENHKQEAIQQMQRLIEKESDYKHDEAMSKFMDELRASNWSTEESLIAFKKNVFDPFVASEEEGLEELRNSLFKNSLR